MFEFNKIITLYISTILIVAVWAYHSISHKKFIFRRTILDVPLTLYLFTLLLSTLFSIDPRSSWLGYYSRFNGGLISQLCYALLYWAFVSNITKDKWLEVIKSITLGTIIASILATLEHYGVFTTCGLMKMSTGYYKSCWVQDVQNRVFSTLGQPNWLAALLTPLIPFTWFSLVNISKNKNKKINYFLIAVYLIISILFFVTLLFTKSRSGLLAFGVSAIIFWGYLLIKNNFSYFKEFIIIVFLLASSYLFIQNPFKKAEPSTPQPTGPALETGGTESGTIRKYVWLGAFNVFKKYPILGSGPETFAFSYPSFKPVEHNLTSEWDFVYNKAHNEYLNYLATTGIFGLASYLALIITSLILIIKVKDLKIKVTLLASYISILATNFFGFSVVSVSLLFYIIPALAVVNETEFSQKFNQKLNNNGKKITGILISLFTIFLLFLTFKYWQADTFYKKAKDYNKAGKYEEATVLIEKSLKISNKESVYWAESAFTYSEVTLKKAQQNNEKDAEENADRALKDAVKSVVLSPKNINLYRALSSTYYKFSVFGSDYLLVAEEPLVNAIGISPNDPKLHYQLGILNLKNNKIDDGQVQLEEAVRLKPNYKEARFALGLTYIDLKKYDKAIESLEYIITNIDPNDELTKKYLDQAKSASE